MYAGKTLKEIAGYDDAFMRWVLCRPRDEHGSLIRHDPDLPWWVSTDSKGQWKLDPRKCQSYSAVFNKIMEQRGMDERQRRIAWAEWKGKNRNFGKGGE
jgi:hypothetical protein